MPDANSTFIAQAPVPPTSGNWNEIKPISADLQTDDPEYLNADYIAYQTSTWVPEMAGWDTSYDEEGIATCTQQWIAGYNAYDPDDNAYALPIAVRQLLSWNRELYAKWATFFDSDHNVQYTWAKPEAGTSIGFNLSQPLVPVRVRVTPRPDMLDHVLEKEFTNESGTTLVPWSAVKGAENSWDASLNDEVYLDKIKKNLLVYDSPTDSTPKAEIKSVRPVFPRMRSQFYTVTVEFARDQYKNRFGIRYAHVEIRPSVRLLSLKNIPMTLVPTGSDGQPDFTALYQVVDLPIPNGGGATTPQQIAGQAQFTEAILEKIDTGFPVREGQLEIRVTYQWVSMDNLLKAGPIGNLGQLDAAVAGLVSPFQIPEGLYLGAVNSKSFLGYSRGRVLYNGCELTPKQSPVTGKMGYRVTHEFLINPNMEWNQARYTGTYNPTTPANGWDIFGNAIAWRTGYMCMQPSRVRQESLDQNNNVINTYTPLYTIKLATDNAQHAIYPYPYMDFNEIDNAGNKSPALLYYGMVGDDFSPQTEG